jgi:hypothetical protein
MSDLENCRGLTVVYCSFEKMLAEAGDNLGTQKKGNIHRWKPLRGNVSEGVDTCLSRALSKGPNPVANPNPIHKTKLISMALVRERTIPTDDIKIRVEEI